MKEYLIFILGILLGVFMMLSLFHHLIWIFGYMIIAFISFIKIITFSEVKNIGNIGDEPNE